MEVQKVMDQRKPTFSKGPWCIKAKGGRYKAARLSRELSVELPP